MPTTAAMRRDDPARPALGDYDLTKTALGRLLGFFKAKNHSPSGAQVAALVDIMKTLEDMAEREADPMFYLSSLDPGVGKSQAIRWFVDALLEEPEHAETGVLILHGRLDEITNFIDDASIPADNLCVRTSDLKINALGKAEADEAQVLITTQQALDLRFKSGQRFDQIDDLFYHGRPRQVDGQHGATVLDFEDTVPLDLAPMLICDASGRVRSLYQDMENDRKMIQRLRHGPKSYEPLTVKVWRTGGGKNAFAKGTDSVGRLVEGVANTIATKADENWLVVHHQENVKRKVIDTETAVRDHLVTLGVPHPTGKSVGRTQFDRYIKVYAVPFLDKVADTHTGVINGTAALDRMLAEAKSPDSYGKHLTELQRTEYWLALLYRRGVTGQDVLAGLIAMSVLREVDPALFKSDQHWRIQAVSRVMGLGNRKKNQVKPGHIQPLQSGLRTRELLLKRIMQPLGPLVLNATRRIIETSGEYYDLDKSVPGVDQPFG